ncbi:hypothetical protein SEPCBS57363_006556 [Sporothrix epigloea]|uniref:Uncharacterized protein n=1 Tax=Sporothrix epigloea TaxID=1892477 RepID=A0ABP0E443_9PEZI
MVLAANLFEDAKLTLQCRAIFGNPVPVFLVASTTIVRRGKATDRSATGIDVSLTAEEVQREIELLHQLLAERTEENEEERRQKEEERQQKEKLQQLQSPTRLLAYLSLVDELLFRSLTVETDTHKSSAPGTTDVSGRFYPKHFLAWTDFDTLHADLFAQLETTLGSDALYPSRNALQALGENSSPLVSDETDLRPFLRNAVEKPAALINEKRMNERIVFNENHSADKKPAARVSVLGRAALIVTRYLAATRHPKLSSFKFRNSSYGEDLRGLGVDAANAEGARGRPKKRLPSSVKTIGNPDRWGFATQRSEQEVYTHVLVGEYKAAHKLRAAKLQAVLAQSPEENFFALAAREEELANEDNLEPKTKSTTRDGRHLRDGD